MHVEPQSPKNLVGVSALPTEKFLRFRKVFAHIYKIGHKMEPEVLSEVSRQSGKFPDSLESFRRVWKVSRQSEQFLNSLKF